MGPKKSAEVIALEKWLADDGNSRAWLAGQLNYKTDVTIVQWLRRGNIPRREVDKVMALITGKAKTK